MCEVQNDQLSALCIMPKVPSGRCIWALPPILDELLRTFPSQRMKSLLEWCFRKRNATASPVAWRVAATSSAGAPDDRNVSFQADDRAFVEKRYKTPTARFTNVFQLAFSGSSLKSLSYDHLAAALSKTSCAADASGRCDRS